MNKFQVAGLEWQTSVEFETVEEFETLLRASTAGAVLSTTPLGWAFRIRNPAKPGAENDIFATAVARVPEVITPAVQRAVEQQVCLKCGACCMDVSSAPLEKKDIVQLSRRYGLENLMKNFVYADQNEFYIDVSRGCCPALDIQASDYLACQIYEHRPHICRKYECHLLADMREWFRLMSATDGLEMHDRNVFSKCKTVEEVRQFAIQAIPFMRSLIHWGAKRDFMGEGATRKQYKLGRNIVLATEISAAIPPPAFP